MSYRNWELFLQRLSKSGPWTYIISIPWEFVRNTNSQPHSDLSKIIDSGDNNLWFFPKRIYLFIFIFGFAGSSLRDGCLAAHTVH